MTSSGDVEVDVEYGGESSFMGISVQGIIDAVRRNWLIILIILGVALAGGVVATLLMSPKYISEAQVLIEDEADQIVEGSELRSNSDSGPDTGRFLQTQIDIITSRSLAKRTVQNANFAGDARFFDAFHEKMPEIGDSGVSNEKDLQQARLNLATDLVMGSLRVDLPQNSRVVQVQSETGSPVYSARVANETANTFIQNNLNRKFDSSSYARQFLSDQLEEARANVAQSEHDLNGYSRTAGLIRVEGQSSDGSDGSISITSNALVQANNDLGVAASNRIAAQDNWETIAKEPVLSVPQVISNGAVQNLMQQKAELQAKLADERTRHLSDYPSVNSLRSQIAELDKRIQSLGNSIKRTVYLEYQAAKEKEDSLKARVSELQGDALSEQDRRVQYNLLQRVADTNKAQYNALLERYNQLSASAGATSNNISLVDSAEPAAIPSSPKLIYNMVVSLFLGLVVAGLVVYLRELFDDAIKVPSDVEAKLGLPMLGLIPRHPDEERGEIISAPPRMIAEAYHTLSTNLSYATAQGVPRTIAVTSTSESEGKTTTSHLLARDIARLGKSVLLVDLDLRRPRLHQLEGASAKPGVTDLLIGKIGLEDALFPSDQPNLTVMTALPIPPDPTVLLGSERMGALIEDLKGRFDTVIFDCPPMLGLADTISIAPHVEGVLFVVDASSFHRGAVKSALRRLRLVKGRVLGVVLCKYDPAGGGKEAQYYGYNYYSYGESAGG
ncbi:polysaccharide biosynthesis tyrosine autokinase [Novosphingobium profundi]|uniref:GumC family protein n=1 Tax=Novosphingobium profundi TaxID=1774954 RepID=UPI001BDAC622|nr:polysaccharide biosynthesis tyrosine autokinase [Novosphingobium profundi]MBT0668349.1 polysaccharide biosynthesis tyrosine autokinase [Novosphingobium profundi]